MRPPRRRQYPRFPSAHTSPLRLPRSYAFMQYSIAGVQDSPNSWKLTTFGNGEREGLGMQSRGNGDVGRCGSMRNAVPPAAVRTQALRRAAT